MNIWELHPALVHFPIALLIGAVAVDFVALKRKREDLAWVGAGLLMAGVIAALVAAVAGLIAFFTVPPEGADAHQNMLIHLGFAASSVVFFVIATARRWKRRRSLPLQADLALSVIGAALLLVAGAIGGDLVFDHGVGVERDLSLTAME